MTDFTKLNEFPIEDVYKTIADLENTNFGSTDFGDIKKKVDLLIRCGFMMVEVPEGKIIYRGRLWDIEKDKVYTSRSEISFPPIAKSGSFSLNRASSNFFQVFYRAVGTPDMEAAEVVALTEICHITEDDFPDATFEYVVIGQWIVKKPFVVASLGLHSDPASPIYDYKVPAYNISKTALNGYVVHLAHELRNTKIKVNTAHPGSVVTDMNKNGELPVEEGAKTSVALATLPADGYSGKFIHLGEELPW